MQRKAESYENPSYLCSISVTSFAKYTAYFSFIAVSSIRHALRLFLSFGTAKEYRLL